MQALSIGIGKTGIQFFAQQFLATQIANLLKDLTPPYRAITVDSFSYGSGNDTWTINNLNIQLSSGSMVGYAPAYGGVTQGVNNGLAIFTLSFPAGSFVASYAWEEAYDWVDEGSVDVNGHDYPYRHTGSKSKSYDYSPSFSSLNVQVVVQFIYNAQSNAWEVTVQSTQGNATAQDPNIPKDSVLQNQSGGNCSFETHVSDATTQAIDNINFATPVSALISGILQTIPGSGNLGNGILYDFSLGDGGILFPNNDGIQMGVKGGASYNGTAFSGDTAPSLPFPLPPADTDSHHLCMYVSNYEVDALNWAFYTAGKLNTVVNADDLPDPNILKVRTYVAELPALAPYQAFVMQAQIELNSAPTTAFQVVYELTESVLETLQSQLPADQYKLLTNLQGNNYISTDSLESDMTDLGMDSTYFPTVEAAAKSMGMVVNHDITFTLLIQNNQPTLPNIVFNVKRTDILGNLALGIGPASTQTMQFQFNNVVYTVNFISSNIPNLDGTQLGSAWGSAGEFSYDQLLTILGSNGVPVPIMQGLQFDFSNAELSIQDSYISILANVLYQTS